MQARGRLVQHVDGAARGLAGKLRGQFDALRLAAGERGRGLAELDVAKADILQSLQFGGDARQRREELQRLVHGHFQNFVDVLALVAHLQRFAVVALAAADLAGHVDVGEEVHLDLADAVAGTGLAAAALDVEAEAVGLVAAGAGVVGGGEHVADEVEHAGIGGGVGARRAADGRLVDGDDLVQLLHALDGIVVAGAQARAVELAGEGLEEYLVDQRTLAAAGNAGDAGHDAEREAHVDVFQVVGARAAHGDVARRLAPRGGHGHLAAAGEIGAGDGARAFHDLLRRSAGDDLAAVDARAGADIDDVVA